MKPGHALLASIAIASLLVSGCTAEARDEAMGVWGLVADPSQAALEVDTAQTGSDTLVVKRVVAPCDCFLVVRPTSDGMGVVNGSVKIPKGESRNVEIPLENLATEDVKVALHADCAGDGVLDFDPNKPERSVDRPIFVDRVELASVVAVRQGGVVAPAEQLDLWVEDQPGAKGHITVRRAIVPGPSWLSVYLLEENGLPGRRVGLVGLDKGEYWDMDVQLDPVTLTDWVVVSLHADRGVANSYEFMNMRPFDYPDQMYKLGGEPLSETAWVGTGEKPLEDPDTGGGGSDGM